MNLHIGIILAVFSIVILSSGLFLYPAYGQLPQLSRQSTSITIQASSNAVTEGSSITFSGKLTDQSGTGIANSFVLIKQDSCSINCILVSGITDQSGSFALTWQSNRLGTISVFALFEGSLRYQGSSSSDVNIQVNQQVSSQPTPPSPTPPSNPQPSPPSYPSPPPPVISRTVTVLSLQSSANSVSKGDTVTFSGKLSEVNGNGVAYTQIHLVLYDVRYDILGSLPGTTGSDGTFSQNWTPDVSGTVIVAAVFDGSTQYLASKSNIVTVYVSILQSQPSQVLPREATTLSLGSSALTVYKGDTITFSGQLTDHAGNGIADKPIRILIYDVRDYVQSHEFKATTDSFGNFNQQWVADLSGTQAVVAFFGGSDNYYASKSNSVTLYISLLKSAPLPVTASRVVSITEGSGESQSCVGALNCFNPELITVSVGRTIVWKSDDSVGHTVTSGKPTDNQTGTVFDSGFIAAGKDFSFTFNNVGTYDYFCMFHPWMTGEVIVEQSALNIPGWIKNNAKWWAEDQIQDSEFVQAIQYLIHQGIMTVPQTQVSSSGNSTQEIPSWIKKNAEWWSSGQILDDEFVKGIQYLISQGIVKTQ